VVLDEVVKYLADQGLGTLGSTLFKGHMPDTPSAVGCVYETGGSPPDLGFGSTAVRVENPNVQVIFRGEPWDYDNPRNKAQQAFAAMAAIKAPSVLQDPDAATGSIYLLVIPLQQPVPLSRDGKNRYLFSCNYAIMKEPTA